MSRTALLAALALGAALAACASEGPGGRRGDDRVGSAYRPSVFLSGAALLFVQFDADRNYETSRAEAEEGARTEWPRAANGAAVLTPIAFDTWARRALGGPNIGPYRLAFDGNVNNEITPEEFKAGILAKFEQFDANKDGVLTRPEMVERLPEPRRPEGPAGGQRPQGPPPR